MNIFVIGINHKTSSIEQREKFYLQPTERELLLSEFKSDPTITEALIVSTCNRTEVYANLIYRDPEIPLQHLLRIKGIHLNSEECGSLFYSYANEEAIEHLFRVAGGLDSLVLGEKQILGQLKDAIELSRKKGMLAQEFNILADTAIRVGKKARAETQIGYGGSSISWAAVTMANKLIGNTQDKSVLVIGSGKMGKLAAGHLKEKGFAKIYVMNRTLDNAEAVAQRFGAEVVSYWDMRDILAHVDVCICSAGAPHYIIEKRLVAEVMTRRAQRKLVCIDISMPRNIDPQVSGVDNVSLLIIDDLEKAIEDNNDRRRLAVGDAEKIILSKVDEFYRKLAKRNLMQQTGLDRLLQPQKG